MRTEYSPFIASALVVLVFLIVFQCCTDSRMERRQQRLNAFREVLPEDILREFDGIEHRSDCQRVGLLLSQAREENTSLDASIDSIMHAELIDCFTDEELVRFFWLYFAYALEENAVPEP